MSPKSLEANFIRNSFDRDRRMQTGHSEEGEDKNLVAPQFRRQERERRLLSTGDGSLGERAGGNQKKGDLGRSREGPQGFNSRYPSHQV